MKQLVKCAFPDTFHYLQTRKRVWDAYHVSGEYELKELPNYVKRGCLAVDVGGNTGVYTYHLSRFASRVITFEPNPDYVSLIRAMGLRNVTIEATALSSFDGHAELRIPRVVDGREDHGMASLSAAAVSNEALSRTISVPVKRLDSYALSDVGFIKIDVEGHEEALLAGAIETITNNRPVLLIEVEERHSAGSVGRVRAQLESLGYSGYFFADGKRMPVDCFSISEHQDAGRLDPHADNRRAMAYINNFLFLPHAGH